MNSKNNASKIKVLLARTLCAIIFLCMLAPQASARNYYGQANDYLQYGVGARSLAMGSAFSGLVNDASAAYYNPAGLAFLDDYQMMAMYAPFFMDTSLNYVSVVYPLGPFGSIGLSDVMMLSDNFEERNNLNQLISRNNKIINNTTLMSYGVSVLRNVSVGANIKLIQEKVFGTSGSAMGADIGAVYQPISMLSLGVLVANINEPSITLDRSANYYRRNIKFGVALKALNDKVIVTSDINKLKDERSYFTVGAEFNPIEYIAMRAGFNQYSELTYGIGFKLKPISIDYAYSPHDLGNLSRVSFNIYWGNVYRARIKPDKGAGDAGGPIKLSGLYNELKFKTDIPEFVVKHWELAVRNDKKELVNKLDGDCMPPEIISWNMLDQSGRPMKKGAYSYTFLVQYKNNKRWVEKGSFDLDISDSQNGSIDIKINNREKPEFDEPIEKEQLQEVPAREIAVPQEGK